MSPSHLDCSACFHVLTWQLIPWVHYSDPEWNSLNFRYTQLFWVMTSDFWTPHQNAPFKSLHQLWVLFAGQLSVNTHLTILCWSEFLLLTSSLGMTAAKTGIFCSEGMILPLLCMISRSQRIVYSLWDT